MVKAYVFSGSLAFQQVLAGVDRPNDRQDIGMCMRPLLGPLWRNSKKNLQKTTLFVIRYRLIIFTLGVIFGYLLLFEVLAVAGKALFRQFGPFDKEGP